MEISNKLIELLLFLAKRNIIFKYDIKEKHLIGHAPKKTIKLSKGSDESSYDLTISYLDNGDFIVLSNAFNNKTLVRTFYEEYLNNLYTTDKDISYIKQYKKLLKVFLGTSFENSIKCIKTNYMFEVIIKNHLMSLQVELHNSLYIAKRNGQSVCCKTVKDVEYFAFNQIMQIVDADSAWLRTTR